MACWPPTPSPSPPPAAQTPPVGRRLLFSTASSSSFVLGDGPLVLRCRDVELGFIHSRGLGGCWAGLGWAGWLTGHHHYHHHMYVGGRLGLSGGPPMAMYIYVRVLRRGYVCMYVWLRRDQAGGKRVTGRPMFQIPLSSVNAWVAREQRQNSAPATEAREQRKREREREKKGKEKDGACMHHIDCQRRIPVLMHPCSLHAPNTANTLL
ncbi:hypothetical protein ACJQWK_08089 [Exserohilum turcicum]